MIVKRVALAMRRQDWTAVAIEFVLVVTSVLMAFQINEWSTEEGARAERTAATKRLLNEAELTVAYLRAGVATQQRLVDDLDYTLGHIQEGSWRSADHDRMASALLRIINAAAPAPPSSVYDDLVASGTLGKIGEAELRTAVADYRATLAFHARYVDYFRQRMPDFAVYESLRYVFARGQSGRTRLQVNFLEVERDGQLQEVLALTAGGHEIMLRIRRRTLKDAERMCVEIGRAAGQTCNLTRPPPRFD